MFDSMHSQGSDIWALGVIVFELWFGRLPWVARDWDGLVREMRGFRVQPGGQVELLIEGCLRGSPEQRWTCEELSAWL
jgi:hypothetical protein